MEEESCDPFESGWHMSVLLPAVLTELKVITLCLHLAN